MSIISAAYQVHNHEDSPSTSSIIVDDHEAPLIVATSEEQTSPISLNEADEFNQEESADFDGITVFVPYDAPNFEEVESSTTALDLSNMPEFHSSITPCIFISQSQYAIELLKKHDLFTKALPKERFEYLVYRIVEHGYVTPSLSKEYVEYLQLFEEEIEERLKHRDQLRHWEMYVNGRPLRSRRERPE
ncbi:hypothetical protein Tco_0442717 [Tanacetum coccineum]